MSRRKSTFEGEDACYHADTCSALVKAHQSGELEFKALVRGAYPGRRLPPGVLPQVSTIGYWDAAHDQTWGLGEHRNEGIEITYLANGHLGFRVDGHPYPLSPGCLTITRPWQPHSVGGPAVSSSRLYWLILDVGVRQPHQPWKWPSWLLLSKDDLRDLTNLMRGNEHPVWAGNPVIERAFVVIGKLLDEGSTDALPASRLALAVNELLVGVLELLREQNPTRSPSLTLGERSVEMFLASLQEELSEPWTLEIMAMRAGLGRTQFAHYCRKLTNLAPMTYLQHLRVEQAKRLLLKTQIPLTEIALDCGFGSSSYFSSVFRAAEQCSPSEYRKNRKRS